MLTVETFFRQDGHHLIPAGSEFHTSCPHCGGKDRLFITPNNRYTCRQCGANGDAIQYLRDFRGLTFKEAAQMAGRDPDRKEKNSSSGRQKMDGGDQANDRDTPPDREKYRWFKRAIVESREAIWTHSGRPAREALRDRGFRDEFIELAGFGFNAYKDRPPAIIMANQTSARLNPYWKRDGAVVWSITFRRLGNVDPGDRYRTHGKKSRFLVCPNSTDSKIVLITEAELDAWLVHQEAGDLIQTISINSAGFRPSPAVRPIFDRADKILVALDADVAGLNAWNNYWSTWPKAVLWPVPREKDPTDYFRTGGDLRAWIEVGMKLK
jgi:hypothetical protein